MERDFDVIEAFAEESLELIAKSLHRDRIRKLLDQPNKGKERDPTDPAFDYCRSSNCHGTLFHLLGFGDEEWPKFVDRTHLEIFLEYNCTEQKTDNGIVIFGMPDDHIFGDIIAHSALYLGVAGGMDTIVHQPDTGKPYALDPLEQIDELYPGLKGPYFYTVKDRDLWVPAPFRKNGKNAP